MKSPSPTTIARGFAGRWFSGLGSVAAALVALSPLRVPLVDEANFAGYVVWSGWLLTFAVILVIRSRRPAGLERRHHPHSPTPSAGAIPLGAPAHVD